MILCSVMSSSDRLSTFRFKSSLLLVSWAVLFYLTWAKIDRNTAHPHKGKLSPYNPGPFHLKLTASDEKELLLGKSVMKQVQDEAGSTGGRAICIQDVHAPKCAVWNQILNFDSYVGKVSRLKECKKYFSQRNKDGSTTIKVKMLVGVIPGYKVSSHVS